MKLVRYGDSGSEKPGIWDHENTLRDLSGIVEDFGPSMLAPDQLEWLSSVNAQTLPIVPGQPRLGPPIAGTRQIFGIGLNYKAHAQEAGLELPAEPIYFMKGVSSIAGPNDQIKIPKGAEKCDWELELGVVISRRCSYVDRGAALENVCGYLVANDLSERAFQIERGPQWTKGKSCETFAPLGPWLVTKDEIPDPQQLNMQLRVNGNIMQNASTSDMVFSVADLVSWLSQYTVLLPGDIILSGTPSGVGYGMTPQRFLERGDVVEAEISGLGAQRQTVC